LTVAVSCVVLETGTVAVAGETVTVVAAGRYTFTAADPLADPLVATTVAAPDAAPVTVTLEPLGVSVTRPAGVADQVTAAPVIT
jgi:hypothetical protein